MMRIVFMIIMTALLPAVAPGVHARACDYEATACEAYSQADAIFVGEVTRIVPETFKMWQTEADYDQTAYIKVEKVYKGIKRDRIVLRQLGRRNAQKFIQHSRYLFYANYIPKLKIWEVRPCGRTLMVEYAQEDLRYLEGLPASAGRTRLSGKVSRYEPADEESASVVEGLTGFKLKLRGAGKEYEVETDASGVYEVYDLPPGKYTIHPSIPSGLTFFGALHTGGSKLERARTLEVEIKPGGCAGVGILLTPEKIMPKGSVPIIGGGEL